MNVIVVEDSRSIRDLIALALTGEFDIIATFDTAVHAIEWDGWQDADVLVTDHAMPGMTGAELCHWTAHHHPNIHTVLTSAQDMTREMLTAADHYVSKVDLVDGLQRLAAVIADGK